MKRINEGKFLDDKLAGKMENGAQIGAIPTGRIEDLLTRYRKYLGG